MNLNIEKIVREEIRNLIVGMVKSEIQRAIGSATVDAPTNLPSRQNRNRSSLTTKMLEMKIGDTLTVSARQRKKARSSASYVKKIVGSKFSIRAHGKSYRVLCTANGGNSSDSNLLDMF